MSLAADNLVANIVHESSLWRNLRLQREGEEAREDGRMLANEDLRNSLDSLGIIVLDSGTLVKCAGPAAVTAEVEAADAAAAAKAVASADADDAEDDH